MEQVPPDEPAKPRFARRLHFPDWEQFLKASDLPAYRQESVAITIRWYLNTEHLRAEGERQGNERQGNGGRLPGAGQRTLNVKR